MLRKGRRGENSVRRVTTTDVKMRDFKDFLNKRRSRQSLAVDLRGSGLRLHVAVKDIPNGLEEPLCFFLISI